MTPDSQARPADARPGPELVKKLAQVMRALERIPKNGYNKQHGYAYALEADVLDAVRKALSEHDIVVLANIVDHDLVEAGKSANGKIAWMAKITLETTWTDGDSAFVSKWAGMAIDYSDKSYWKAYSNTLKYALMKTLLVSTGDDDAEAQSPEVAAATPAAAPPASGRPQGVASVRVVFRPKSQLTVTQQKAIEGRGYAYSQNLGTWVATMTPAQATREKENVEGMDVGTVEIGGED